MDRFDFSSDIKNIIRTFFKSYEVEIYDPAEDKSKHSSKLKEWLKSKPTSHQDSDETYILLRQFINFHKRIIRLSPREVKYSSKIKNLSLSATKERKIVREISNKLRSGQNVNPYQSKDIIVPYKEDQLLASWRIYHLHLNNKKTKHHFFVDRSDKLLMIFLTDEIAYLLDIRDHREFNEDNINLVWSRNELFSILASEFPEAIKRYKLGGVLPPKEEDKPSDLEIRNLRKAGISAIDYTSEATYVSPGGGIATDGSSVEVTQGVFQYRQMFKSWSKYLTENEKKILLELQKNNLKIEKIEMRLDYNPQFGFHVYEKQTEVRFTSLSQKAFFNW